jgi:hypothetical protein
MAALSRLLQLSIGLLATAISATPLQLQERTTIGSNDIVGFAQAVPSGTVGSVYLAYKPYLKVVNGCVPFPAVNAAGATKYVLAFSNHRDALTYSSEGLATAGASNGECSSNTGQIYVRGATSGSYYGVMYSWYVEMTCHPPTLLLHSQVHAQRRVF